MQIQWPKLAESTRYPEITLSCTSFRTAKVKRESTTIITSLRPKVADEARIVELDNENGKDNGVGSVKYRYKRKKSHG